MKHDYYAKHTMTFSTVELLVLAKALGKNACELTQEIQKNEMISPAKCAHMTCQLSQLNQLSNRAYNLLEQESEHVSINAA